MDIKIKNKNIKLENENGESLNEENLDTQKKIMTTRTKSRRRGKISISKI